jgi:hypothetical protein
MPKYIVTVKIYVPKWEDVEVEAATPEEAKRKIAEGEVDSNYDSNVAESGGDFADKIESVRAVEG